MQQLATLNFLVPAEGGTQVLGMTLPGDGMTSDGDANGYVVDFKSLNLVIQGELFIPQSCTIDASGIATTENVTMTIPAIGWNRVIVGGTTQTFQFPAFQDLRVSFTPSSGTPSFNTFWYNYPALPDNNDPNALSVTLTGAVAVSSLPADEGNDQSANPGAVPANTLKTIAFNPNRIGWFVQNQSAELITVRLQDNGGTDPTLILLEPHPLGAGHAGDSIDGAGLPFTGIITIMSPAAGSQVAAREF